MRENDTTSRAAATTRPRRTAVERRPSSDGVAEKMLLTWAAAADRMVLIWSQPME